MAEKDSAIRNSASPHRIISSPCWDGITENKMRRRLDLWDAKEVAAQNNGRYTDRVTELLRQAMDRLGEEFLEQLVQADDNLRRELDQNAPSTWEKPGQDGEAPEAIGGPELRP